MMDMMDDDGCQWAMVHTGRKEKTPPIPERTHLKGCTRFKLSPQMERSVAGEVTHWEDEGYYFEFPPMISGSPALAKSAFPSWL